MDRLPILELKNITKTYPGVIALDDISLAFDPGTIHAIVGENGAGKSTFIKTITGAETPDEGCLYFDGSEITRNSPERSINMGISAIYQEFNLFPYLTVAENIFSNSYTTRMGLIDFNDLDRRSSEQLKRLGVDISPRSLVKDLSIGYQQLVEIAKSLAKNVRILIMDEPSAALTNTELEKVFSIMRKLKQEGVTIIYISHRLEEIFEICDLVSVFRDGKLVHTSRVKDSNKSDLIRHMVNRPLDDKFPQIDLHRSEKVLEVKNLCNDFLSDVSFSSYRGERLGFAGLIGAGRSETARAVFGADKVNSGEIYLNGKKLNIKNPSDAIKNRIALIPEDRKQQGALLHMSVMENISIVKIRDFSSFAGYINKRIEHSSVDNFIDELKIKTPSRSQLVKNLSGGNQQKVVLAKWLLTESEVIFFDEPTRGIDVGAKQEIYQLINNLAQAGKSVIIISSELPELLGMSDRIIVMSGGSVVGELESKDADQEKIMHLSAV